MDRTARAKVFYITPDDPLLCFCCGREEQWHGLGQSSEEWRGRKGLPLGDKENGQVDR